MDSTASSSPAVIDVNVAPDWQTITLDVKCPLCGYNLRGLVEPRCPECGYQFDWPAVLDPNKQRHPYLFEHHPRSNIRSFFQTLFRSPSSPARFWYTLEPSHQIRTGRLVLYWLIYASVPMLAIIGPIAWIIWEESTTSRFGFFNTPWTQRLLFAAREMEWSGVIASVVLFALFPWFNLLALLIFQQSLRRSRIRPLQVLRCAIYCGDVTLFIALGLIATMAVMGPQNALDTIGHPLNSFFLGGHAYGGEQPILILIGIGFLAMVLLNATRLWVAYRVYLRFESALMLILASQVVVVIAIIALLSWTSERVR